MPTIDYGEARRLLDDEFVAAEAAHSQMMPPTLSASAARVLGVG